MGNAVDVIVECCGWVPALTGLGKLGLLVALQLAVACEFTNSAVCCLVARMRKLTRLQIPVDSSWGDESNDLQLGDMEWGELAKLWIMHKNRDIY